MVSFESVQDAHTKVLALNDAPLTIAAEILWTFIGLCIIVDFFKSRKFTFGDYMARIVLLIMVLAAGAFLTQKIMAYDFSLDQKTWKQNYLNPYIQSLPVQEKEVVDFKQPTKTQIDKTGIKSNYLNPNSKSSWVQLLVRDSKNQLKTITVQVVIHKENIKKSYVKYRKMKKSISSTYNEQAYYETHLYVPEGYKILAPVSKDD
ncbi:hypothetical protein A374_09194 [Fictibacillus macauensis ZFHKF-1]|uniref:Uncharacterized protein n=1 Tax=Fictibacillus macauensis ZFHKF-1 TaxID=1196324 RepID=I8UGK3_9BACL|nr:hypothetical protein [Fictibacillus macauensis]EIT86000.1 hypothetical protein A374_09194 [Fictibacillus macauensis ZFHKF-1]